MYETLQLSLIHGSMHYCPPLPAPVFGGLPPVPPTILMSLQLFPGKKRNFQLIKKLPERVFRLNSYIIIFIKSFDELNTLTSNFVIITTKVLHSINQLLCTLGAVL